MLLDTLTRLELWCFYWSGFIGVLLIISSLEEDGICQTFLSDFCSVQIILQHDIYLQL